MLMVLGLWNGTYSLKVLWIADQFTRLIRFPEIQYSIAATIPQFMLCISVPSNTHRISKRASKQGQEKPAENIIQHIIISPRVKLMVN